MLSRSHPNPPRKRGKGKDHSLDRSPAAEGSEHGGNQKQQERDEEDDLGELDRDRGDTAKSQDRGNQRNAGHTDLW